MNKMKLNKKGFTLIEMLVVLIIIGVLVSIALPRFATVTREARIRQCDSNVQSINSAIELYNSREGRYPESIGVVIDDENYFPDGAPTCPYEQDYTAITEDGSVIRCERHNHAQGSGG